MSLLLVGVSHRTAEVPVLERVAVSGDDTRKVLDDLEADFEGTLLDKPLVLGVGDITGDTMTFQVMTKCIANQHHSVLRALRRECKDAFDAARIRGAF